MKKILLLISLMFLFGMNVWAYTIKYIYDDESNTACVNGVRLSSGEGDSINIVIPETVSNSDKVYTVSTIKSLSTSSTYLDGKIIASISLPPTITSITGVGLRRLQSITMPIDLDVSTLELYLNDGDFLYHVMNGHEMLVLSAPNNGGEIVDGGEIVEFKETVTAGNTFTVVSIDPEFWGTGNYEIPENWNLLEFTSNSSEASFYFRKNGFRYRIKNDNEVSIAYLVTNEIESLPCSEYRGDIVIPSTVTTSTGITFQVTSIDDGAFSPRCGDYYDFISSIIIPDNVNVTSSSMIYFIKNGVCYEVLNNNEVGVLNYHYTGDIIIPSTVTAGNTFTVKSINYNAFSGATLSSIIVPDNVSISSAGIKIEKDGVYYKVLNNNEVSVCGTESSTKDLNIPNTVTAGNTFTVKSIENNAFSGTTLSSITIPDNFDISRAGIKILKDGVYYKVLNNNEVSVCDAESSLTEVTIPNSIAAGMTFSVISVKSNAFSSCPKLTKVTCLSTTPPEAYSNSFVNYNGYLYIPCDNKDDYEIDVCWGAFKHIECIGSKTVELTKDEVAVVPEKTEAEFSMPKNENANSYTLTISNNGVTFCTLTFNSQGQLSNIDFSGNTLKASVEGYQFTVTGLSAATDYGYSFKALDKSKSVLKEYTGSFTTKNADGTGGSSEGGESGEGGQGGNEGEQGSGYTITVLSANEVLGTVYGEGSYEANTVVTIIAIPERGNQFVAWNDGNTDNPRKVVATKNATYIASFESNPKTDISNMDNSVAVSISNNQIFVNGEAPEFVYTILGQKIANQNLKAGIYYVQVGNEMQGVSIK